MSNINAIILRVRTLKLGVRMRRWEIVTWDGEVVDRGVMCGNKREVTKVGREVREEIIKRSNGRYKAKHKRV